MSTSRAIADAREDVVTIDELTGAIMSNVGTFRIDVEVENPARPGERRRVERVLVDTGAELSWIPADILEALGIERFSELRFRQANGTIVERWVGPFSK